MAVGLWRPSSGKDENRLPAGSVAWYMWRSAGRLAWASGPGVAAGRGGFEALAGALDDQLVLELIDRAEGVEDQPPGRRSRVDLLPHDDQADAAHVQLVGQRQEMLQQPHRAGQPDDDEDATLVQVGRALSNSGRAAFLPDTVSEDLVAPVGVRSSTWLSWFWLRVDPRAYPIFAITRPSPGKWTVCTAGQAGAARAGTETRGRAGLLPWPPAVAQTAMRA